MQPRRGRVTTQEAYVFLGQVRGCENRIKRLQRTIESLRCNLLPGAIRYDKDRVQTSPMDPMGELFCRIDEYERELQEELSKRTDIVLRVDTALGKMKDTKERTVLLEYYIGRIGFGDIAAELGVSYRHCLRLRKNGVEMFAGIMTEEEK